MAKRNDDGNASVNPESTTPAGGEGRQAKALLPIEMHFQELQVPDWVQAGMMAENNWAAGKEVSRSDFISARDVFLYGPISKEAK